MSKTMYTEENHADDQHTDKTERMPDWEVRSKHFLLDRKGAKAGYRWFDLQGPKDLTEGRLNEETGEFHYVSEDGRYRTVVGLKVYNCWALVGRNRILGEIVVDRG